MSMEKKYHKTKPVCRTTFTIPPDQADGAAFAHLVGEMNGWDETATPMERHGDGSFSVSLDLEVGREYQFRYLLDGRRWENDWEADRYAPSPYGDSDNSVVVA
ncbi:MAG: isoamylase early set domain-containing protein [Desulfatibacillaceae bacterium]